MGPNFLRIERRGPPTDAWPFYIQESCRGELQMCILPLPGIRGIHPYAPFWVLRQFGTKQTMHREEYYGAYVYDIGDDRVHDASEMLREWKNAKRMGKDFIAPDRFNAGYDKGYKAWLKRDIQNISFQIPRSFRSVTDKEAKVVAELWELKEEANEVYA